MIRTTQVTITKDGGDLFDEGNFVVSIEDLAAGEFVVVRGLCDEEHTIAIDPKDWPELCEVITKMIGECRADKGE